MSERLDWTVWSASENYVLLIHIAWLGGVSNSSIGSVQGKIVEPPMHHELPVAFSIIVVNVLPPQKGVLMVRGIGLSKIGYFGRRKHEILDEPQRHVARVHQRGMRKDE